MNAPAQLAIDVSDWPADEEAHIYPEGSREKALFRCPAVAPHPALTPGHRYLFKKSRDIYPEQFWVEIAATRIGALAGVPVPLSLPAFNSSTGESGALIEWFWGRPGDLAENFVAGGYFMKSLIKDYDYKKGRQHNFATIELFCRALANAGLLAADWPEVWARIVTFDALIGNTDRHHDNWGFVVRRMGEPVGDQLAPVRYSLSPAFDNGTSMGHEIRTQDFVRFDQAAHLNRYIARGHHHLRWHAADEDQMSHAGLILKIGEKYPKCRPPSLEVLQIDRAAMERELTELSLIDVPQRLSPERGRFMLTLLRARLDRLSATLVWP